MFGYVAGVIKIYMTKVPLFAMHVLRGIIYHAVGYNMHRKRRLGFVQPVVMLRYEIGIPFFFKQVTGRSVGCLA